MRHRRGHEALRDAHRVLRAAEKELRRARTVESAHVAGFEAGTVVRARVPFADGTGEKVRPVVVVDTTRHGICGVPVGSRRGPGGSIEVDLGTGRRSWARPTVVRIDRADVVGVIGALPERDTAAVVALTRAA